MGRQRRMPPGRQHHDDIEAPGVEHRRDCGPGALTVPPRVGHVHVTVDDAPWHWADASGTPIILRGLPPGTHKVQTQLVDPNHQVVDSGAVTFSVP